MKIVALLPIKNEAAILRQSLTNIELWADSIIVADQASTDESREICKEFSKVTIIENPYEGHSNRVRWLLLDEARKIPDQKLIVCIDADEVFPAGLFVKEILSKDLRPGDAYSAPWIQLWQSPYKYNATGVWKNSYKPCAFVDNGVMDYERVMVLNDHTSRIPSFPHQNLFQLETPLLHFQFVDWERTQWKQAWYRCNELIARRTGAMRINHKYSSTLSPAGQLSDTPPEWLVRVTTLFDSIGDQSNLWHRQQILVWFKEYGIIFFESLQIWHIKELQMLFEKEVGRAPRPVVAPWWLIALNNIKNTLRSAYYARFS